MLLRMFGIGVSDALAGSQAEGRITRVNTCWWLKINTKSVRTHIGDGAVFPHIIHFTYSVAGQTYSGKRWINWNQRCPVKDEKITVHYEEANPEKYAVMIRGEKI